MKDCRPPTFQPRAARSFSGSGQRSGTVSSRVWMPCSKALRPVRIDSAAAAVQAELPRCWVKRLPRPASRQRFGVVSGPIASRRVLSVVSRMMS